MSFVFWEVGSPTVSRRSDSGGGHEKKNEVGKKAQGTGGEGEEVGRSCL